MRIEERTHEQQRDETHDPQQGLVQLLHQQRAQRAERGPQDHRARRAESAQRQHHQEGQDQDVQELGEAVDPKIACPGEDHRVERREQRIEGWGRRRQRRAGDEIYDAPGDRERERAGEQRDRQPLLQLGIGAVLGIDAKPACPIDEASDPRAQRTSLIAGAQPPQPAISSVAGLVHMPRHRNLQCRGPRRASTTGTRSWTE